MADQNNDKTMAIIAYILFFVPLLAGKRSAFVNYHTNQGTVLFITAVGGQIILNVIFPMFGFFAYGLFMFVANAFNLFILALAIIGILNVTKNETKPLPLIGGYTVIK